MNMTERNNDKISIHALLAESDLARLRQAQGPGYFYPRSPCGERPGGGNCPNGTAYFYPRSPCGERPGPQSVTSSSGRISIHALLAESDCSYTARSRRSRKQFLSTLSLRRATSCTTAPKPCRLNFYPRSPCGERRPAADGEVTHDVDFYPRSPCGERHQHRAIADAFVTDFYPRSPCGERLLRQQKSTLFSIISIHALLAESDRSAANGVSTNIYFYPRSPCGERPKGRRLENRRPFISIHALLAESD